MGHRSWWSATWLGTFVGRRRNDTYTFSSYSTSIITLSSTSCLLSDSTSSSFFATSHQWFIFNLCQLCAWLKGEKGLNLNRSLLAHQWLLDYQHHLIPCCVINLHYLSFHLNWKWWKVFLTMTKICHQLFLKKR